MEKDQKNTCTICGLQRYEFDIQNPNKVRRCNDNTGLHSIRIILVLVIYTIGF